MYKGILLLFLLLAGIIGSAQTINTIAGNGIAGYNADGVAVAAEIWSPGGVAVRSGVVYLSDRRNNRIRIITRDSVITIAGMDESGNSGDDGPATGAMLNDPAGLAFDASGNLYVADKLNNRIRKITPAGMISAFAGNGVQGYSGDGGPAMAAQLNAPVGLVADARGNVYISDAGNHIRKVSPDGVINAIAGTGVAGYNGDTLNAIAVQLNGPNGMAVDTAGNLYIADTWNYRIRKITPAGVVSTIAGTGGAGYGGDGSAATDAELNLPAGITIDKNGYIYVTEQGNNRIRRISPEGTITTLAGNGNAGFGGDGGNAWIAELNEPNGIVADANYLYFADQDNNRIRRIVLPPPTPKVVKTTKAAQAKYNPPPFTTPPMNRGRSVPYQNQYYAPPVRNNNYTRPKGKG